MDEIVVKILDIKQLTHDVMAFRLQKPTGYTFVPGQATEVSVNLPGLRDQKRPFTFTSLNSDPFLEFTIKIYNSHNGVTKEIGRLKPGDELIIRDVWGAISYKGKGVFIAGGAGITPFLSIFRDLLSKHETDGNMLIFANRTRSDIILEKELGSLQGLQVLHILSDEKVSGYHYGLITKEFLESNVTDLNTRFYVCGPPPMMDSVLKILGDLGVGQNSLTVEI